MASPTDILTALQQGVVAVNALTHEMQVVLKQLASGSSGQLWLQAGALPNWVTLGGDATINSATGVLTLNTIVPARLGGMSNISNALSSDVALNSTAFFDGPSVAQGSSGTWFAIGTITCTDTSVAAILDCKLWDGTTTIAGTAHAMPAANSPISMTVGGVISSPAGNIRISARDFTSTNGIMRAAGQSGLTKVSNLAAIRIG